MCGRQQNAENFERKCITSDLSERFSDFKSIKKVIQQYFKLNRNVIEIILETLESYAQERNQFYQKMSGFQNSVDLVDLSQHQKLILLQDLEKQVKTKKADYITQKQRADEINYQLLPKSIAEEFKAKDQIILDEISNQGFEVAM